MALAGVARADPPDLVAAERAEAEASFEEAHAAAERAHAAGGLTRAELTRLLRVLAISAAALGRAEEAEAVFTRLLAIEPGFALDARLGPRAQAPFFRARGFWQAQPAPAGIELSATATAGQPARVAVRARDPMRLAKRLVIAFRYDPKSPFGTVEPDAGTGAALAPRPPGAEAAALECFAQALDEHGSVLFEAGDPAAPRVFRAAAAPLAPARPAPAKPRPPLAPPASGPSLLQSPVFWAVAGAIVVGAAATTVLVATR